MKEKNILLRRYVGMILGVLIISVGIAVFKESHLGNDPISALNMRLAEIFGISLGLQNLYANIIFLIIQIFFGRKYIGVFFHAAASMNGKYSENLIYSNSLKTFLSSSNLFSLCGSIIVISYLSI